MTAKSTVGALEGMTNARGGLLEGKESKASKGWILSFMRMTTRRRAVRFRKSKLMKFLSGIGAGCCCRLYSMLQHLYRI
jgi:hypothetical protein